MNSNDLLGKVKKGFKTININDKYKEEALNNIKIWLEKEEFSDYWPQIEHIINSKYWDYLLDSFYQIIPFGTGGRRGEVGIGTNRINQWTIRSSAQGHSQYLIKKYGDEAKKRGVVLAYDTRVFYGNKFLNNEIYNPVNKLDSSKLAKVAAEVYAGNGIKVYLFDSCRTTPELSFAIRHLKAIAGDVISASHNPPDYNGKKVYDENGGQLIPPFDEELINEVTKNVNKIFFINLDKAIAEEKIIYIGSEVDQSYVNTFKSISLSDSRNIKIVYTPLHGCGSTSVEKVLINLGFNIVSDPKTSNPSGKFENVTFNIPNPEVIQSFETTLKFAEEINADIVISTDPDADRIGIMFKYNNEWKFINGNEIGTILTEYVIKKKKDLKGIVIKTEVTTSLIEYIAKANHVMIISNLLVGFKYIGEEMNKLEQKGEIQHFLIGIEESHGYITGNYIREKDATPAAIWISELAAELKEKNKTLLDYLNEIYSEYGFVNNYLTEIRLPGAEGMSQIQQIQTALRNYNKEKIGKFEVDEVEDWLNRTPIVSETDRISKNGLVYRFKPIDTAKTIKITIRPSGTEPKIKMYFEIGGSPFNIKDKIKVEEEIINLTSELEKSFMKKCYKFINIDFPDRGFLLFWQLPLNDKLKYFEVEEEIIKLNEIKDAKEREIKLKELLIFLGSDPIKKVDKAFIARYEKGILEYLNLK